MGWLRGKLAALLQHWIPDRLTDQVTAPAVARTPIRALTRARALISLCVILLPLLLCAMPQEARAQADVTRRISIEQEDAHNGVKIYVSKNFSSRGADILDGSARYYTYDFIVAQPASSQIVAGPTETLRGLTAVYSVIFTDATVRSDNPGENTRFVYKIGRAHV